MEAIRWDSWRLIEGLMRGDPAAVGVLVFAVVGTVVIVAATEAVGRRRRNYPGAGAGRPTGQVEMSMSPVSVPSIMWLLLVIFMIHDFEEIIMLKPWLDREAGRLQARFPRLAAWMLPHLTRLSTSAFALAVAEEFVLLSVITLVAVEWELYALWAGTALAICVHLAVHGLQFVVYGRYVPALITSVLCAPAGIVLVAYLNAQRPLRWPYVAVMTAVALGVVIANVAVAHALAAGFEGWLRRRSEG